MAEDCRVITPMLVYDDAPAAIEFLCRAFGFEERSRFDMPDGRIGHAELCFGGARIALGMPILPAQALQQRGTA